MQIPSLRAEEPKPRKQFLAICVNTNLFRVFKELTNNQDLKQVDLKMKSITKKKFLFFFSFLVRNTLYKTLLNYPTSIIIHMKRQNFERN